MKNIFDNPIALFVFFAATALAVSPVFILFSHHAYHFSNALVIALGVGAVAGISKVFTNLDHPVPVNTSYTD